MLHKKLIALALAGALLCPAASAYTATTDNSMDVTTTQLLTDLNTALQNNGADTLPHPTTSGSISVTVYHDTSFKVTAQGDKVLSIAIDWILADAEQAESFGQLMGAILGAVVPEEPFVLVDKELEFDNVEETGIRSYYVKPFLLTYEVTAENARFAVTIPPQEQTGISLSVNDRFLTLDAEPVMENNRTLVPLRGIFEAIGAEVSWNNDTRTAIVSKDKMDIEVAIGSATAKVNGTQQALDVPAKIVEGRTLVPVRFIAEALGAQVGWNNEQQIVLIST